MGKSSGPAPNYQGAAEQQAQSTWAMNHPNVNTPFASTTWSASPMAGPATGGGGGAPAGGGGPFSIGQGGTPKTMRNPTGDPSKAAPGQGSYQGAGIGGTPTGPQQYSMNTQLSPELQSAMDAMVGQLRGGAVGGGTFNAAYNQATSRLDPQWSQRQNDMTAQLAAQGLDPSSQAYQTQMGNFGRDRNDAYSSAENNAFGQGLQAFGANMQGLQGLYSFLQGPSFAAGQGPNYLGAAEALGNFQLGQGSQQNQAAGQAASGAGQAIGAALPLLMSVA